MDQLTNLTNYQLNNLNYKTGNQPIGKLKKQNLFEENQYQNVNEFQINSLDYQVPLPKNPAAYLKRAQFSQQASKSFPIQNNQLKNTAIQNNDTDNLNSTNCLKKGRFNQQNSALNKISNRIDNHPLASKAESGSFTLNYSIDDRSSRSSLSKNLSRFSRTQSTTSAISLPSISSSNFVSASSQCLNNNILNNNGPINNDPIINKNNSSFKSNIVRTSSYTNTPALPICANQQATLSKKRTTQSSFYSMQSFKSNYLAPFQPENYFELNGVESVTSSSYLHGFMLILIILLSITAFIFSILQDACKDFFFYSNHNSCYQTSQYFYSSMLLITSLYAFIIYFLHLIGQCDYLNLMAKRKVFIEILVTCLVIFFLLLSSLTLIITTVAIFKLINTISLIIAFIVCILYKIRIYLLFREYRMLNDKPEENRIEVEMNDITNQQVNQLKRLSLQSNQFTNQIQVKGDEFDDDVFG